MTHIKGNYEGLHRRIKMNRITLFMQPSDTGSLDLIEILQKEMKSLICVEGTEEDEKREKTVLPVLKVKLGNDIKSTRTSNKIIQLKTQCINMFSIFAIHKRR